MNAANNCTIRIIVRNNDCKGFTIRNIIPIIAKNRNNPTSSDTKNLHMLYVIRLQILCHLRHIPG